MNFLSIEALQLTTQGENCMSGVHFGPGSVIHSLVQNKFDISRCFSGRGRREDNYCKVRGRTCRTPFFHHSSWILKLPNREFEQPQRLRQIKSHFKINICRIVTIL